LLINLFSPNHPYSQLWRLVWTAQRHKGGARRAEDSRGVVHAKRQSEHRPRVRLPVFERKPDHRRTQPTGVVSFGYFNSHMLLL
jgi:hypothetical protein